MPIDDVYFAFASGFYSYGSASSWSLDIDIPAQPAYARAALASVGSTFGGSAVWCGVTAYTTFAKGKHVSHTPPPPPPGDNADMPAMFDDAVSRVTFGYFAEGANGDCVFEILGFG